MSDYPDADPPLDAEAQAAVDKVLAENDFSPTFAADFDHLPWHYSAEEQAALTVTASIGEFSPPVGQPRDWHGRWLAKGGAGGGAPALPPAPAPSAAPAAPASSPHTVPSSSTRSTGADAQALADSVIGGKPIEVDGADVDDVVERFANAPGPVDLTLVSVKGAANCFSEMRGNGIPRSKMPQIPKDRLSQFQDELRNSGFEFHPDRADPGTLKATQSELDGKKVGGMITSIHGGKMDLETDPLWVSSDGKVLDGHHRWAATASISQDCGGCLDVPVIRVNAPMDTLLSFAQGFVDRAGIARVGIGAAAGRMAMADQPYYGMATDEADGVDDADLENLAHGDGSSLPDFTAQYGGTAADAAPPAADGQQAVPYGDRFVQTEPMLELQPNEVFVPPTIEELGQGSTGTILNTETGESRPA